MPAISNLTLADGQATPANHTFAVKSIVGRLATYEERSAGVSAGYKPLTISTTESAASVYRRVRIKIVDPVLEAVSGVNSQGYTPAAKEAYNNYVNIEFVLHERSNLQNRKDILAYAKSILGSALASSIVIDGEEIY